MRVLVKNIMLDTLHEAELTEENTDNGHPALIIDGERVFFYGYEIIKMVKEDEKVEKEG